MDLVQIYYKLDKQKHGKWLFPRVVLAIDRQTGIRKVPASMGKTISTALKEVRIANKDNDIVEQIFELIDDITDLIISELDSIIDPI